MKNTYIAIIVLVLVAGGAFFFMNKKSEAPATSSENITVKEGDSVDTSEDMIDSKEDNHVSGELDVHVGAEKSFTVTGTNFSFSPSTIKVKKGDRVKITFKNSEGFHDFVIDEFGAATKQTSSPSTEVLEFTANKTGSFEYYCSVGTHRMMGMKGTLIVE